MDYTGFKFNWKGSNYIVLRHCPDTETMVVQCQLISEAQPTDMTYAEFRAECKNVW